MKELWKIIPFTMGKYKISNKGRLKINHNFKQWIITPLNQNHKCYKTTDLLYLVMTFNKKTYYIHRIVAELFIPNPENKPEVNHKDFNSLNNCVENLEWVTSKENKQHSSKRFSLAKQGEKHPLATLKDITALNIKKDRKSGMKYKQLMNKYNLSQSTIANVCTRYYKHLDIKC